MWSICGKSVHLANFEPFQPLNVLYEFDGPKTFTFLDQAGALLLAHWCDEDEETVRYIAVPITTEVVPQLECGDLTLRQALDQPSVFLLDVDHDGSLVSGVQVDMSSLPQDALPKPGTKLSASLEKS